jgi:hypothetical protein
MKYAGKMGTGVMKYTPRFIGYVRSEVFMEMTMKNAVILDGTA